MNLPTDIKPLSLQTYTGPGAEYLQRIGAKALAFALVPVTDFEERVCWGTYYFALYVQKFEGDGRKVYGLILSGSNDCSARRYSESRDECIKAFAEIVKAPLSTAEIIRRWELETN